MGRTVVIIQNRHASSTRCTILYLLCGVFPRAVCILHFVKIRKQPKEQDTVQTNPDHKTARIVALDKKQLELMAHDHHELYLKSEGYHINDNEIDNKNSINAVPNRCGPKIIYIYRRIKN